VILVFQFEIIMRRVFAFVICC